MLCLMPIRVNPIKAGGFLGGDELRRGGVCANPPLVSELWEDNTSKI